MIEVIEIIETVKATKYRCRCSVCHLVFAPSVSPPERYRHECPGKPYNRREAKEDQRKRKENALDALLPTKTKLLLGDRVAEITKRFGFPPCEACGKRQAWLNNIHQWASNLMK